MKILADETTDRVLGVHIVGADAGNLISEVAVAMEFAASAEDIARAAGVSPRARTRAASSSMVGASNSVASGRSTPS